MSEIYKTPNEQANAMQKPTIQPRRTLRDLDDFQSYLLPEMNAQEYFDALKNDKDGKMHDSYWNLDTAFRDTVENAIMGELGISPSEFHKVLKSNSNPEYIKAYEEWIKNGKKPMRNSWDFNSIYDKDAFLKFYRPQEKWGKANQIHAQDEWDNFNFNGLREEFDPFKKGYETARKSWNDFLTGPWGAFADSKFNKIIEWLDKNKNYF